VLRLDAEHRVVDLQLRQPGPGQGQGSESRR
jgi:hypothetical protein